MSVDLRKVCGKSEGKIFQDTIQACRHIITVSVIVYFKLKLQLKFRNKDYSPIIVGGLEL